MSINYYKDRLNYHVNEIEAKAERIFKTQGYTLEVKRLRLLAELIKEQFRNENSSSPVSTPR